MLAKSFTLLVLAATTFAGVIPKDEVAIQAPPTGPPTTSYPLTLTATKIIHTLLPTSPWLTDITTVIVWTQWPPGQVPTTTSENPIPPADPTDPPPTEAPPPPPPTPTESESSSVPTETASSEA